MCPWYFSSAERPDLGVLEHIPRLDVEELGDRIVANDSASRARPLRAETPSAQGLERDVKSFFEDIVARKLSVMPQYDAHESDLLADEPSPCHL